MWDRICNQNSHHSAKLSDQECWFVMYGLSTTADPGAQAVFDQTPMRLTMPRQDFAATLVARGLQSNTQLLIVPSRFGRFNA